MKTYPEILGRNMAKIPEAARSEKWFMSLPQDQRKYLWFCVTERSHAYALRYILTILATQARHKPISKSVSPPKAVEVIPAEKRQKSALPRSPIPVPYILDFGKYLLLLSDRHIRTNTSFDASYQYVALGSLNGDYQQICFASNFRSLAGKISWLRKNGSVVEDIMIHELKPG